LQQVGGSREKDEARGSMMRSSVVDENEGVIFLHPPSTPSTFSSTSALRSTILSLVFFSFFFFTTNNKQVQMQNEARQGKYVSAFFRVGFSRKKKGLFFPSFAEF
jgi:hypothetical protein